MKASSLVILAVLVFIGLGFALPIILDYVVGEENPTGQVPGNITLSITSEYGQVLHQNATFDPSLGLTTMEMVRNMTQIETSYGGMFLSGMHGLESDVSRRLDWFFYVNGAFMDRGLVTYVPKRGEVVQVDYHFWGNYAAYPGFLSGYPRRFQVGLDGKRWNLTIASGELYQEAVSSYAGALSTFCNCSVTIVDPQVTGLDEVEKNLVVLVGPGGNALYSEMLQIRRNAFWPVTAEGGRMTINHLLSGEEELADGYALMATDLPGGRWALLVFATGEVRMEEALKQLGNFESPGPYPAVMSDSRGSTPLPVQ